MSTKIIKMCKKDDPFCNCHLCTKYWEHMDTLGNDEKINPELDLKLTDEMIVDENIVPIVLDDFDDYEAMDDFDIDVSDI